MNKASAILLASITFVGGFGLGHVLGSRRADTSVVDENVEAADEATAGADIDRYRMPVTAAQPTDGPADALVTIVEFSEFQCPFCKRVGPTVKKIKDTYGNKVRFVWRNNPLSFHKDADPAAQLAMEAFAQGGNKKFWKIHDVLFENQKQLSRPDLERYAEQAGLDMAKVKNALDNKTHSKEIRADQALAKQFGASGTPNFFINGRNLRGAQPFEKFKEVIDDEIKRAEALVAKGTAKKQVYAALTKGGLTKAKPREARKPKARPGQADPSKTYKITLEGNEPQKGPDDALVTIVEISDFQCPFCKRVGPTIDQIVKEYGKDVRIVWFNNPLPFHKNAGPAATVALEAHAQKGDKAFWKMHDKLFENQRQLTRDNLEKLGKEAGLNMSKLKAALDQNKYQAVFKKQQALAQRFGARGTPAFFINGRNLRGAQPFPSFKAVIDEELKKAKELVAKGTPRNKVYEATIAKGLTKIQAAAAPSGPDPNKIYNLPLPANAPYKGGANAKVIIQEFSDFQCPYCSRVGPTIKQIEKEYGNKVKIVWRDYPLPFHKEAHPAAQAAREVFKQGGNKKFWAYHDKLFQNQRQLTRDNLESWAKELGGINMTKFRAALDNATHKATVDADMAAVAKAGARIGTPSFFVNGKLLQGAQPFDRFKAVIDEALAKK